MDTTLRNFGEDLGHFLVYFMVGLASKYIETILEEGSLEEIIHEVHLTQDVEEVHELAEYELCHVKVVSVVVFEEIIDNDSSPVPRFLSLSVQAGGVEILNQKGNFLSLPNFPDIVRQIA